MKNIKKIGLSLLGVTFVIGMSALTVGLVSNSVSAGDDTGKDSTSTEKAEGKAQRGHFGFKKRGGGGVSPLFSESTSDIAVCLRTSAEDVLGIDSSSDDLSVTTVKTKTDHSVTISDGSKTVTLTEELKTELKDGAKACWEEYADDFGLGFRFGNKSQRSKTSSQIGGSI